MYIHELHLLECLLYRITLNRAGKKQLTCIGSEKMQVHVMASLLYKARFQRWSSPAGSSNWSLFPKDLTHSIRFHRVELRVHVPNPCDCDPNVSEITMARARYESQVRRSFYTNLPWSSIRLNIMNILFLGTFHFHIIFWNFMREYHLCHGRVDSDIHNHPKFPTQFSVLRVCD